MDLFLAGAEILDFFCMAAAAAESWRLKPTATLLSSYWAMHNKKSADIDTMWSLHDRLPYCRMIVDSGLFTMMFGAGKGQVYTLEDLKKYATAYLLYLQRRAFKGVCVEMDVHKVLGLAALRELRAICETLWPVERMIFVWHIEEGIDGLRALVDRYPYIALSIPELRIIAGKTDASLAAMVNNLLAVIRSEPKGQTVRVHLLGCTQLSLMRNPYYDSVDSTAWEGGVRWGRVPKYHKGKIVNLQPEEDYLLHHSEPTIDRRNSEAATAYINFCTKYGLRNIVEKMTCGTKQYGVRTTGVLSAFEYMRAERDINETYYAAGGRRPYDPWL